MTTNNMNNNGELSTSEKTLKEFIIELIISGEKPKSIIKKIDEYGYDHSRITDLSRYIDNIRQRNKDMILKMKNNTIEEQGITDIERMLLESFENLKLKGIVGEKAISELKNVVKSKFNETLEHGEIIEMLKKAKIWKERLNSEDSSISELNDNIEDVKKYTVSDGNYVFHLKKSNEFGEEYFVEIKLPISLVDGLFYDFSRFGKGMSGLEILQKYRLKPEVFSALKSRLNLYKASNVISPYTLENSSDSELEEKIDGAVSQHIQDKYKDKFVKSYDKIFEQNAKKALKIAGNVENVIELVREGISQMEPIGVDRDRIITPQYNSDIAIFVSSDYHFGEDDDDILEKRIDEMVDEMIRTKELNINWISLGDLAETFLEEGMHAGQTNRMTKHGFDLVRHIYKIFVTKMIRIIEGGKKLTVDWQGGNHDRMGKTNDMDRSRTWALVIGEMIELSMKNYIDQGYFTFNNYKGPTIRRMVGKLGVIANHGDGMWHKLKNSDILAKFGFGSDTYHLILEGDKHHFIANQDTNSMKVVTSSVKSGGQYSEEVIYKDSVPGYLKITETKSGKANITMSMFDE